jgi:uncharacterized protein (TIGR00369 family)
MLDPELEKSLRARFAGGEFSAWMGLELAAIADGLSEVRLHLKAHHLNPGGIVHGGVVAAILDSACGLAHRTQIGFDSSHVTIQLHVTYLKPVREGLVIARGTSLQSGQRVGHAEAALYDTEERVLARADATFMIVPASEVWRERTGDDA